ETGAILTTLCKKSVNDRERRWQSSPQVSRTLRGGARTRASERGSRRPPHREWRRPHELLHPDLSEWPAIVARATTYHRSRRRRRRSLQAPPPQARVRCGSRQSLDDSRARAHQQRSARALAFRPALLECSTRETDRSSASAPKHVGTRVENDPAVEWRSDGPA